MKAKSKYGSRSLVCLAAVSAALLLSTTNTAFADDDKKINILRALVSPPVVSNGTIAGEPTEVIGVLAVKDVPPNLAMDPENFGYQIKAGGRMEVELGGSFERNGVDNGKLFRAIGSNANFVLVTGLPQAPITAPAGTVCSTETTPSAMMVTKSLPLHRIVAKAETGWNRNAPKKSA